MKRFGKSTQGVTLLEIMLVLAIAAMVIVMSVRYYQSASSSQQANAVLQQIQGITAAADSLAQASGSYVTANLSKNTIAPLVPGGLTSGFITPWGTDITITVQNASSYQVDLGQAPSGVCPLVVSKLTTNNHYTVTPATAAGCNEDSSTALSYVYIANP